MHWHAGFIQILARITATLLSLVASFHLIYAVNSSPKPNTVLDSISIIVACGLIAATILSFAFLEFKGKMEVIPDPKKEGGDKDLNIFHETLNQKYKTKLYKREPDKLTYIFSQGDRQFYYHLARGIIEEYKIKVIPTII